MHGQKFEDAKKEIRSILLTYTNDPTLEEFLKAYRNFIGQRLPSRELGFSSDIEFLKSIPDVVDLQSNSGKIFLRAIADESSQHIKQLVSKQRKPRPSNGKCHQSYSARQPVQKLSSRPLNTRESKPFLPGSLRFEILELMNLYNDDMTLTTFALAYQRKFKKSLPVAHGFETLEAMIKLIPELEVSRNENNIITVRKRKALQNSENQRGNYMKYDSPSETTLGKNERESSINMHESGIPHAILNDFQRILQKYPDGIQNIHFPPLYENITGKPFDVVELGYNSMADLVEALPHIFKRISNPEDEQCWLIYPAKSQVKQKLKAENNTVSSPESHLYHPREGIPADILSPTLQYSQSNIPDYINLSDYHPIFISAIVSPSLFWFHLLTKEFTENFDKLEKDMENFYSNTCNEYKMNSADIAIGASCIIQCPDDNQYYRAVIKSIPSTELVNVSFVDYGSRDSVPKENVYYMRNTFHEYPAYAFKAQQAGLKPAGNADSWSSQARKRFVDFCNCPSLMALIKPITKDNYSVYLCDTNGEEDIHLYNTFINEGLAENCNESHFDNRIFNSCDSVGIPNDLNITIDSGSDFVSSQNIPLSDTNNASETSELPVNRNLPYSTDIENNVEQPNKSHFIKDKFSKRYVKEVEVCEGSKIHLINLENKLFISCGELCGLLWSEKNTNFLLRKLMNKEIVIPFLEIKKEDNIELFQQCLWYKVPGFETKDSDNLPPVLCPLEEAYKVLNIFGHPSICLRVIIQHELKIFESRDEFWNEFLSEEFLDLSSVESDIEGGINKLCLYDLKAKSEAFKMQKLKLLRLHSNPPSEQIRRIENTLTVLTRRMKQIEAICNQYSSCS